MITEFFITPEAIACCDCDDGGERIRELKSCLFPFATAPTALICRLGDDQWIRAVSSRIVRLANVNHRHLAQALFTQIIDKISVTRLAHNHEGDDEGSWVATGLRSSASVSLGSIVVSDRCHAPPLTGLTRREFVAPGFWENFSNPRVVSRNKTRQESPLRAICAHAEWLILRFPQIRGGCDDEIVTAKQIIQLSNELPAGFPRTDIDLHLCNMRNINQEVLVRNVRSELDEFLRKGVSLTLTLWPEGHFVNRELIGGMYTSTSEQTRIPKPLWWITMSHVAVARAQVGEDEAGNTWNLFSREQADQRVRQITSHRPIEKVRL